MPPYWTNGKESGDFDLISARLLVAASRPDADKFDFSTVMTFNGLNSIPDKTAAKA